MKNVLIFAIGFFTGVFVLLFVSGFRHNMSETEAAAEEVVAEEVEEVDPNLILFPEPGEEFVNNRFEIREVFESGDAIAYRQDEIVEGSGSYYSKYVKIFFLAKEGEYYYDGQILKATSGKCFKQIGIYKYERSLGSFETLPVVSLLDK